MEDETFCHTAKSTQIWFSRNGSRILPWSNQFLDMNPIEYVCGILGPESYKRYKKPFSKPELLLLPQKT